MSAKFGFANYIVRIYRSRENDPQRLVGVVEEAGGGEKKVFTNLEELWKILNSSIPPPRSSRPAPSRLKAKSRRKG